MPTTRKTQQQNGFFFYEHNARERSGTPAGPAAPAAPRENGLVGWCWVWSSLETSVLRELGRLIIDGTPGLRP
jgi:hypothetical protein